MRIKSKASKLISVLLVAVMIVTTVSVSFAETEQISDVTTPAAQEVDVLSASDDSSAKASDANQASDVQASDVQASGTQESGTDATDSTEAADSNVTSTEGETEEDVILSSESDEEAVEEGIALLAEQGYTIKQFDNNSEAIMELQVGGSPAAILDKPVADYFLTQDGKGKFDVIDIPNIKPEYLAFAINKDNKELLKQVNDAMAKLKETGEFQKIYKKWFNTDMPNLPTSSDEVLK